MVDWIKRFKQFIKICLLKIYTSLPDTIREWIRSDKVTILLYHEISPELFKLHIDFIKSRYTIISLKTLKNILYRETKKPLPKNALVITFDDGWRSNYHLLPIIQKTEIPVTIFLTTGLINTHRKIWNYTIDRRGNDRQLNEQLKSITNEEKNNRLYEINGYYPEKEYQTSDFLTINEMRSMVQYVDFQSHGMFHSIFTKCSEKELRSEMLDSKKYIEDMFKYPCYAIAYPYGIHGSREVEVARHLSYSIGRTANRPGLNTVMTNPYRLKAIGIDEKMRICDMDKQIAWQELCSIFRGTNVR